MYDDESVDCYGKGFVYWTAEYLIKQAAATEGWEQRLAREQERRRAAVTNPAPTPDADPELDAELDTDHELDAELDADLKPATSTPNSTPTPNPTGKDSKDTIVQNDKTSGVFAPSAMIASALAIAALL